MRTRAASSAGRNTHSIPAAAKPIDGQGISAPGANHRRGNASREAAIVGNGFGRGNGWPDNRKPRTWRAPPSAVSSAAVAGTVASHDPEETASQPTTAALPPIMPPPAGHWRRGAKGDPLPRWHRCRPPDRAAHPLTSQAAVSTGSGCRTQLPARSADRADGPRSTRRPALTAPKPVQRRGCAIAAGAFSTSGARARTCERISTEPRPAMPFLHHLANAAPSIPGPVPRRVTTARCPMDPKATVSARPWQRPRRCAPLSTEPPQRARLRRPCSPGRPGLQLTRDA